MNMDSGRPVLKEISQDLHVSFWIGPHRPAFRHFFERDLSIGAVLNGFRISDIEVGLPGLRPEAPKFRRLVEFIFPTDYHVLFDEDGHSRRIFPGISSAFLKFSFVFLPCLGIRNEPVSVLSAPTHCLWSIARH